MSQEEKRHSQEHVDMVLENQRNQKIRFGVSRCIDTLEFKHTPDQTREVVTDELIKRLKDRGDELLVTDNGWTLLKNKAGNELSLKDEIQDLLLCDKTLVDQSTVVTAVSEGRLGVQSKSDLRDVKAKVAYIAKFGEDAFLRLPSNRQPKVTSDLGALTAREYLSLSSSERCKISGLVGPRGVSEILKRK